MSAEFMVTAFNANALIRELRKASGLTQEKLAEGICSRSTINMIEQGKRKPDWYIFKNVLWKLGVNPYLYYNDVVSEVDSFVISKHQELIKLINAWEYDKVYDEVKLLENDKRFTSGEGYRILLRLKSIAYAQGKHQDSARALGYQIEEMKLHRPDFDINNVNDYFLSAEEIAILSNMVTPYQQLEGQEKGIEILEAIIFILERDYSNNIRGNGLNHLYFGNLINLCSAYKKTERWDDCITTAEKVMKYYVGDLDTLQYAYSLHYKAFSLLKLGKKDEGEALYKKFLLYVYIFEGYAKLGSEYKEEFVKEFGYKLDLSVEW